MKDLINFRCTLNLTQKEMARQIGVSKSYYEKVEGCFKNPGRGFLEKFNNEFPDKDLNMFFKQKNEYKGGGLKIKEASEGAI